MKKILLIGAGGVSLSLGIVGIFVPLLPTTPFFLLSAYFFLKSSARLHGWLVHHRIFGSYIKNYLLYRAISRRAKLLSLVFLWTCIIISAVFVAQVWWLRIVLLAVAAGVTVHLLRLRTLTDEMKAEDTEDGQSKD